MGIAAYKQKISTFFFIENFSHFLTLNIKNTMFITFLQQIIKWQVITNCNLNPPLK